MQLPVEYAPEYGKGERLRVVLLGGVLGLVAVAASRLWLFPSLRAFAGHARCTSVLGVASSSMLLYGLFVGLPVLGALVAAATVGRRGVRILREERVPPAGEKVFRPTVVQRGRPARRVAYLHLIAVALAAALALWGLAQATGMRTRFAKHDHCPAAVSPRPLRVTP